VPGLRFRPTAAALAQLFAVPATTIGAAQRRIWPLLAQAGYPTDPVGPQLKTLNDLTAYAHDHGLAITPRTKVATPSDAQPRKPAC
jgi:hypothetical protein